MTADLAPEANGHGDNGMDRSFLKADVDRLVAELTLMEKVSLLTGQHWWEIKVTDGPNGARGGSFLKMTPGTVFPNATAIASTFSTSLVEETGQRLAAEAKARGAVCLLAPTINIQRSPLGGRAFESFSEDPTLSGHLAAAYVSGLQSCGVSATLKHFVGNDQEHERNGSDSVIAPRALREVYLRPFQITQKLAAPWAIMTAYNKVNGTHVSENDYLLRDILRGEWGYEGLVMSDWYGTYSISESLNAGLDLEMPGPSIWRQPSMVAHLLTAHKIDPRTIDRRVTQVLRWVQRLARANPELAYAAPGLPEGTRDSPEDVAADAKLVRQIGREGIIVLKNERAVLPVTAGKVAVIGPNAKAFVLTGGGSAQLRPLWAVSPWEGLVGNKPEDVDLSYSLGCQGGKMTPMLSPRECVASDGKHLIDVALYNIDPDSGAIDTQPAYTDVLPFSDMLLADIAPPGLTVDYVAECTTTFTAPITGKYRFGTIATGMGWLYVDDKLVIDNSNNVTLSSAYFGNGTEEVFGIVDVVQGQTYKIRLVHDSRKPASRPTVQSPLLLVGARIGGFPLVDEVTAIEDAVAAARAADKVVLVAGLNSDWESEGYDRPDLSLPRRSDELIARVAEANPNTVVVIQSGSAVAMPWIDKVAGVVQAWYGGNECGNAIADIVYGIANPSGRLPLSFPVDKRDIAANLNYKSARTQVHYEEGIWVGYKHHNARGIAPLFPFGHGLSYTSWAYEGLEVVAPKGNPTADDWKLTARVTVKNTGRRAGDHSVHFYTAPPAETATSLVHPEVALQGFTKVYNVQPGASAVAEVTLDKYAISHWDELDNAWRVERGTWAVKVGVDAQTMAAEAPFEISHEMAWRGL